MHLLAIQKAKVIVTHITVFAAIYLGSKNACLILHILFFSIVILIH